MLGRLNEFFIPHSLRVDPEQRRRAELAVLFVLVITAAACMMGPLYLGLGASAIGLSVAVYAPIVPACLFAMRFTGKQGWAAHGLCLSLWTILTVIASLSGGIAAPAIISYVVVVLIATLLGGKRAGVLWLGVVSLGHVLILIRTNYDIGVSQTMSESMQMQMRVAEGIVTASAALLMALIYERAKERMATSLQLSRDVAEGAHQDVRLILDNTGQGFVRIDDYGTVVGEHSLAAEAWLGKFASGDSLVDLLSNIDPCIGEYLDLGLEAVRDGFLPAQVCLTQLPERVESGNKVLSLAYLLLDDETDQIIVVISDISDKVAQELADAEQHDLTAVCMMILNDRKGFRQVVDEIESLLNDLSSGVGGLGDQKRWLHSIKGSAGLVGLHGVASACHRIESELETLAEPVSAPQLFELKRQWSTLTDRFCSMLEDDVEDGNVVLDPSDYRQFVARLIAGEARAELIADAETWVLEPTLPRLNGLAKRAASLASRLGKGEILVVVESNEVRVQARDWDPFWVSMVHIVRNAVDHGLQTPEQRKQAGKTGSGTLVFRTRQEGSDLLVEMSDDGGGINWDGVRDKAIDRRLAHDTEADLVEAIFAEGLSTRQEATDISGRGIGLSAVRQACEALGGSIKVRSESVLGTCFSFRFPRGCQAESITTEAA